MLCISPRGEIPRIDIPSSILQVGPDFPRCALSIVKGWECGNRLGVPQNSLGARAFSRDVGEQGFILCSDQLFCSSVIWSLCFGCGRLKSPCSNKWLIISTRGAQSLVHGPNPTCGAMACNLQGFSHISKFSGKRVVTSNTVISPLLPNYQAMPGWIRPGLDPSSPVFTWIDPPWGAPHPLPFHS